MRPFLALLASLVTLPQALATTFMPVPFPTAVEEAPVIVRGRVGSSYANWGEGIDKTRRIYTFTEIQIAEVLKGKGAPGLNGSSVIARELGGEKDGMGMQVAGVSEFKKGEDVVVTLANPNSDGSRDVRGMMMGKYNVVRDDTDGKEYLEGPGVMELTDDHTHADTAPGKKLQRRWSINDLKDLIKTQAAAPKQSDPNANSSPFPAVSSNPSSGSGNAHPAQDPASGLQRNPDETPSESPWFAGGRAVTILISILLVLIVLRFLITRKK
ncbi:hypothetical protein K2X30_14685 [bacterium]|jgi:hypothetical protein|nr:hypothetical protein [bacterium]